METDRRTERDDRAEDQEIDRAENRNGQQKPQERGNADSWETSGM